MSYSIRKNPASKSNYTSGRQGSKINKIICHHAATTSFDGIGATFKNRTRGASAHYGVGRNSNVDKYVNESDIAWHAGNWDANRTSVGIENVNSSGSPKWDIDPKTVDTLVELLCDIAKRHDLLPLKVGVNLFGHKDFTATACPGKLYKQLRTIAKRVNKLAGKNTSSGSTNANNKVNTATDQILTIGSKVKFKGVYKANKLKFVNGIWQVQSKDLCKSGFTWNDNGIPVAPITKTNKKGKKTKSQVMANNTYFTISGKYKVVNLGKYKNRWLAQLDFGANGKLWVDTAPLTEVK